MDITTPAYKKDLHKLLSQVRQSAKKRGIPCSLTLLDLNELSFPISCPVLNCPLTFNRGAAQDNSYSIDRIDSSKGYEVDNVIIVSNRVNKLKSDATIDELTKIVNFYSAL